METKMITKSRNYIFTINNYTDSMLEQFNQVAESLERHKYICYGLEVAPETGTKHIQGYIQLDDNQAYTFLHNYFNLEKKGKKDKFHLQPARGTLKENQDYTSKEKDWYEFGIPKNTGRSDLTHLRDMVEEEPHNIKEIIQLHCSNNQQVRYVENIQKYYFTKRDREIPPKVYWIYGTTGIGKSKLAYDSFESVCSVSDFKWPGDNYMQEECFLLDDYRQDDLSFQKLLKITDRFPLKLALKGGSIQLNSPYIVITCPQSIDETFQYIKEDLNQLKRRIIAEICLDNEKVENLKEYNPKVKGLTFINF